MPAVIITATERSVLYANAPTAAQIEAALAPLAIAPGGWIGPHARITRTAMIGERFGTTFAALYAWPEASVPDLEHAPVADLVRRVDAALADVSSGWQGARAIPYAPAVHGSVAWWSNGQASITRTRDTFPTGSGRVDADENPIGPTTPETHPTTPGQVGSGAANSLSDILTPLAWCIGLGSLVYFGAPLFQLLTTPTRRRSRAT